MKKNNYQEVYQAFLKANGVSTDTRKIDQDCIFFALRGENFDANTFAAEALSKGAAFVVIDREEFFINEKTLLVEDVLDCLQQVARIHRENFIQPVIGLTGSNGKTTTKELIRAILSQKYIVLATEGNLNNHIGVPLTLLKLKKEHEIAVIEMGANHQKEIEFLSSLSQPDYGLITSIGKAHLEGFGGFEGVIKAKSELYQFIGQKNGQLVINGDDELLLGLGEALKKTSYGTKNKADLFALDCEWQPWVGFSYQWKEEKRTKKFYTHLTGRYNLDNVLSAVCFGKIFGIEDEKIIEALEKYAPDNNRSQWINKGRHSILMDAYNANPSSMMAALENFVSLDSNEKTVFLGDMFELGTASAKEHENIVRWLSLQKNVNCYYCGERFMECRQYGNQNSHFFDNTESCLQTVNALNIASGKVLIKGSRGMKMERCLTLFENP
jgi:UDP-N-acetylmuramoyl-tripeptide--D-alanyl-D-alanine ligase